MTQKLDLIELFGMLLVLLIHAQVCVHTGVPGED